MIGEGGTGMKILVTGGCGYIGSHTLVSLIEGGFEVISADDNSRSSEEILEGVFQITGKRVKNYRVNLCDLTATKEIFRENPEISGIIDFAAYKSVPESVEKPLLYYRNNLESLTNVLDCAQEFKVSYFVFSSSCSVYGNIEKLPVTEESPLNEAECPYAYTKQIGERICRDLAKVTPIRFVMLRYFNPVGAHESGLIGEVPYGKLENLVPVITQTAIGKLPQLTIFGDDYPTRDGTCIRDYIHVMDIASAHTKAIQYLIRNYPSSRHCERPANWRGARQSQPSEIASSATPDHNDKLYEIFNLGSGNGVSVLEAVKAFEKSAGVKLNYKFGPKRAGDVIAIYADNQKAREKLGWDPKRGIDEMMSSAWKWELNLKKKEG
jgi:UDP-glucose 4-epimerase